MVVVKINTRLKKKSAKKKRENRLARLINLNDIQRKYRAEKFQLQPIQKQNRLNILWHLIWNSNKKFGEKKTFILAYLKRENSIELRYVYLSFSKRTIEMIESNVREIWTQY